MGTWMNPDGLYKKYGTTKATATTAGEFTTTGQLREIEFKLDLTTLGTASAIIADTTWMPKMRLAEVEIRVHTAATGAGAVLNIGIINSDRTTAIDADGLVAALALTSLDAAGETMVIRVGSTGAGALLGTTTTTPAYFVADYDTAAYTAGVIFVKVRFYAA